MGFSSKLLTSFRSSESRLASPSDFKGGALAYSMAESTHHYQSHLRLGGRAYSRDALVVRQSPCTIFAPVSASAGPVYETAAECPVGARTACVDPLGDT
jgi:hypothetical protein